MEAGMSVKIETVEERRIVCDLGAVTFHDETGSVRFRIVDRTPLAPVFGHMQNRVQKQQVFVFDVSPLNRQ
jgi:hypothetical protein